MKTAIQELIERLYEGFFTEEEKKYYLELEKKQICDSNNRGYMVARKKIDETAKDYYEHKYKN
jgi:hypothetical protein